MGSAVGACYLLSSVFNGSVLSFVSKLLVVALSPLCSVIFPFGFFNSAASGLWWSNLAWL